MNYGAFEDHLRELADVLGNFGETVADAFINLLFNDSILNDVSEFLLEKKKPSRISHLKHIYGIYKVKYKMHIRYRTVMKNLPYQRRLYRDGNNC